MTSLWLRTIKLAEDEYKMKVLMEKGKAEPVGVIETDRQQGWVKQAPTIGNDLWMGFLWMTLHLYAAVVL